MTGKWTTGAPVIAGGEGSLVITEAGRQITLANVSSVEANIEHDKSDIQPVGHRLTLHKVTGGSGSGSMTVYYMSSRFGEYMEAYKETGVSPYFDMIITNDDPASPSKRQIVRLMGVNLDSDTLATLDGSHTELTVDLDFTFEDYEITESFCPDKDAVDITEFTQTATDDILIINHLAYCIPVTDGTGSSPSMSWEMYPKGAAATPTAAAPLVYMITPTAARPVMNNHTVFLKSTTTDTGGKNTTTTYQLRNAPTLTVTDMGTSVKYPFKITEAMLPKAKEASTPEHGWYTITIAQLKADADNRMLVSAYGVADFYYGAAE